MLITPTLSLAAAVVTAGMAGLVFLREKRSLVRRLLVAGLVLLAGESLLSGLSCGATQPDMVFRWQRFRLLVMSVVPGVWLLFSLTYARGNYRAYLKQWRYAIAVSLIIPPATALIFWRDLLGVPFALGASGSWGLEQYPAANSIHVAFILIAVAVLMNLERTFRAATGTMRWRIKFMVLGVAMPLAVRIYSSTQALLYSALDLSADGLNAGVLLICQPLVFRSLLRTRLLQVDLYPSQRLLYRSFTAILAGLYLLVVGIMAHVATRFGNVGSFPLKAFLLFVAIIGLSVLTISDRLRQTVRHFVARQFGRPMYDCRKVWNDFTEHTASATDVTGLSHSVSQMVSDTFEVLSVTVWLMSDMQKGLAFGHSTSLAETEAAALTADLTDGPGLVTALRDLRRPVNIGSDTSTWAEDVKRCNPIRFPERGGDLLCVPLAASGELLGLMVLADRVRGVPYTLEELDLLKTIGEQVGARLLNLRLSERLLEAKQMEAFQAMSAFFVHDLKNTSSTLSLMLQNLPKHFGNPTFRDDALAAMSKSVAKINDLIQRLTTLRQRLDVAPEENDLNKLVTDMVTQWNQSARVQVQLSLHPLPRVNLDPDQIQKVLTNLLLNAADAVGDDGEIRVETVKRKDRIALTVSDNGCGMDQTFLDKSLFHPFKSTKPAGMGIGLFHSKMIVEAHRGRLEVESEKGKGSAFRILLPV